MRVSILSAAALAFGVANASLPYPPVVESSEIPLPETSICSEDLTDLPSATPTFSHPTQWTTSTILSTSTYTVTKCPTTVKNCPLESIVVTTAVVTVGTTVCPVTEDWPVPTWTTQKPPHGGPPGTGAPPVWVPVPETTKPAVWGTGSVPVKPEPTKAVPVTAGAGRAAAPVMAAVALVAALL